MTQKITVMEQKCADETQPNMITKVFRFLVFIRFIPIRLRIHLIIISFCHNVCPSVTSFQLRRRSSTSPNVCPSVRVSVCLCESRSEILSKYAIFTVPECSRLFKNVPECSRMHAEYSRKFQNVCRMFQQVPECIHIYELACRSMSLHAVT